MTLTISWGRCAGQRHWGRIKLYSCINFPGGYSWAALDPSGFGRTGVILPAVNATFPPSVLAEGISRQHWWEVCSYTSWGLSKKAILTHDSRYCSSVAGRSLRVYIDICLFCVMTHRGSEQMFIFPSKQDAYISPLLCPLYVGRNIPSPVGLQKHFVSGYLCVQIENKECPKECRVMPVTLTSRICLCPSHTSLSWTY